MLFPVTGLMLLARFITRAASKIVTVQVIGGYQAGAMAGAAQMLRRRPSTYAARVLQPVEISGEQGGQPDTPLARTVSWSSLPQQGTGTAGGRVRAVGADKPRSAWKWLGRGVVDGQPIAAAAERAEVERGPLTSSSAPRRSSSEEVSARRFIPQAVELSAYNPSMPSSRSSSEGSLALASVYRSRSVPLASIQRSRSGILPNIASIALSESGLDQSPSPWLDKPRSPPPTPAALRRSVSYHASLSSSPRSSSMGKAAAALRTLPCPSPGRNAVVGAPQGPQRQAGPVRNAVAVTSHGLQRQAARQRQQQRVSGTIPLTTGGVLASVPCLDGSLVVHNVLACVPSASPFVVLRALALALRRQASRQRRTWWGRMMSASLPGWPLQQQEQQQRQPSSKGHPAQLRPAAPLVHVYNFLRGIPLWLKQVRGDCCCVNHL